MKKHVLIFLIIILSLLACSQNNKLLNFEVVNKMNNNIYEKALANFSTAPNYIVVKIKYEKIEYETCVEPEELMFALAEDQKIKLKNYSIIVESIKNNKEKLFIFKNYSAFKILIPTYTKNQVEEYSKIFSNLSLKDVKYAFSFNNPNNMHYLYNKYSNEEYYSKMRAIAHSLFNKGILTGRGCLAPFLYIDEK